MWDEVNPNLWITNENTQISQYISIENATFTWAGKINISEKEDEEENSTDDEKKHKNKNSSKKNGIISTVI